MTLRAVLFDWCGPLVTTLDEEAWATEALHRLGRDDDPTPLADGLAKIADGPPAAPGARPLPTMKENGSVTAWQTQRISHAR